MATLDPNALVSAAFRRNNCQLLFGLTLLAALPTNVALASINWDVSVSAPGGAYQSYYAPIQSNLAAALEECSELLASPVQSTIQIEVSFSTAVMRSTGFSDTSVFVANQAGVNIFEQGVAAEIRTGIDPNGSLPDLRLKFEPDYLAQQLWFDPSPKRKGCQFLTIELTLTRCCCTN
jgi:hypothetical protein